MKSIFLVQPECARRLATTLAEIRLTKLFWIEREYYRRPFVTWAHTRLNEGRQSIEPTSEPTVG